MWRIASALPKVATASRRLQQKWQERGLKSLAISVYFKHPDLGMDKYEVLIRSSAFMLAVDPPEPEATGDESKGLYSRLLDEAEQKRQKKLFRREFNYTPAGGPRRHVKDLGWLEFCPQEYRPIVHLFTSRHVLAPWKYYPNYFKADFLQIVGGEHCIYFVEVYDTEKPGEPALARFDLSPYPVLHPLGMDMGMIHLKDEMNALSRLKELGVEVLHLREDSNDLLRGEELITDGYELAEPPDLDLTVEDTRYFVHISEPGTITGFSDYRYFMNTARPLPEGSCGGPVLDKDGRVAGIVEAIVSPNQTEDGYNELIGQASVIPPHLISQFVAWSEQQMLQQIVPKHMYEKVIEIKAGRELNADSSKTPPEDIDTEYEKIVANFKKRLPPEKFDALMATMQRDKSEVLNILDKDGGDLEEVEAQVRAKNWKMYESILEELVDQAEDELEASENAKEAAKEAQPVDDSQPKEAEFVEKTSPPSQ